jgi:hypothetical protein
MSVDIVHWASTERGQTLTASVGTTELSSEVVATDETRHALEISIKDTYEQASEQSVTVDMQQTDTGISLNGRSKVDLIAWDWIAETFSATAGAAELIFEGIIPHDAGQIVTFNASVTPSMPLQFTFAITPDDIASVSVHSASTLKLSATYPQNQWSVSGESASSLVSYGQWKDMSVDIGGKTCR